MLRFSEVYVMCLEISVGRPTASIRLYITCMQSAKDANYKADDMSVRYAERCTRGLCSVADTIGGGPEKLQRSLHVALVGIRSPLGLQAMALLQGCKWLEV